MVILLTPEAIEEEATKGSKDHIFGRGGITVAPLSPTTVVRFGSHVTFIEAKTILYVKEHSPTIPAPEVSACYTYGPLDRDIEDSL